MKRTIGLILTFTIMIGVIGAALNLVFGSNTVSYITVIQEHGITMQKYNFASYLETLSYQFSDISKLTLNIPTLNWNGDIIQVLTQIGKVIVLGLNIIIYPLRIAAYIIGIILAILGINLQTYDNNPLAWLITLVNTLTQLQIPMPN